MESYTSGKVGQKGQVVIPIAVRKRLGIDPRDKVEFRIGEDGTITVHPVKRKSVLDCFGSIKLNAPLPDYGDLKS